MKNRLIILLIFTFSISIAKTNENSFTTFIEEISLYKSVDEFKNIFEPEAYVAFGDEYTSYYALLDNSDLGTAFNELIADKVDFVKAKTSKDESSAYIYLRGKNKKGETVQHSLIVQRSKEDKWLIHHWHAG